MSVLHIGVAAPDEQAGGLNRFVDDLARAQQAGHSVRVLVLGARTDGLYRSVARLEAGFIRRVAGFVRAGMREVEVDVLHLHFALTAAAFLVGRMLARKRDGVVVFHFHGPWAAETVATGSGGASVVVKSMIERAVHSRADRLIVLSEVFADRLRHENGVAREDISVVAPGVDLERFTPGDRSAARRRLGVPDDVRLVACARRLVARMGVDDGVRALAESAHEPWFLVVGEGRERQALEAYADGALPGRSRFLGRVDDATLLDVYRAADCTIVPSRELEGFGLVCLESMASGTPVVARPQGGLVEALQGFAGIPLLAASMTVDDLRLAVDRVLDDAPSPSECREYAEGFSWAASVQRTDVVYAEARAGRHGRARGWRGAR